MVVNSDERACETDYSRRFSHANVCGARAMAVSWCKQSLERDAGLVAYRFGVRLA